MLMIQGYPIPFPEIALQPVGQILYFLDEYGSHGCPYGRLKKPLMWPCSLECLEHFLDKNDIN